MITPREIAAFEELGFELTDSFHQGIYGRQVFRQEGLIVIIGLDKCYYEASIHPANDSQAGGQLLPVLREVLHDEDYFKAYLAAVDAPNRMHPKHVLKMLQGNLAELKGHFTHA